MARSINNVDPVLMPVNRGILGKNGYPPFTLLIIRVHNPLFAGIASVQSSGLLQKTVNQSGFTVIDMSDNCDISEISFAAHNSNLTFIR